MPAMIVHSGPVSVPGPAKESGRSRTGPSESRKLQKTFRLQDKERALPLAGRTFVQKSGKSPLQGAFRQDSGPGVRLCAGKPAAFWAWAARRAWSFLAQGLCAAMWSCLCQARTSALTGFVCFVLVCFVLVRCLFLRSMEIGQEPEPLPVRLHLERQPCETISRLPECRHRSAGQGQHCEQPSRLRAQCRSWTLWNSPSATSLRPCRA